MEFSDIALAKLLQTLPELGPLILTFQDVTEELNEETGMQVGIFVLRSGADLFYVPVVSKGENVYPIDSIFFDSKKKFFPLTKKTVASVLQASQVQVGKATKIPQNVTQNPSVYNLITPPRTGKYVYASSSRLTDFLAAMPGHLKTDVFEKIAAEKSVYDRLDEMFGLKSILDVLRANPVGVPAKTNEVSISVARGAETGITDEDVQNILKDGYVIKGGQQKARVAVSAQNFNHHGVVHQITEADGDKDYDICFAHGDAREAFVPRLHKLNSNYGNLSLALFTNGDYALCKSFVAIGTQLDRKAVLKRMFDYIPPVLLRDTYNGDTIVIMTSNGEFLGPFHVTSVILNQDGVEVKTSGMGGLVICGYRNFVGSCDLDGNHLYLPHNSIVIKLGQNVTVDLEHSVNSAHKREEMKALRFLGSEMNLGFDGIEYTANGRTIGGEPDVMEMLVVREGLAPDQAKSFVKQAQELKFVKIYMSKEAASTDYNPAETPTYGGVPQNKDYDAKNPSVPGLDNGFIPNVQQAMQLGDSQIVESSIISELLQCPDVFELISEYLPDIEEAIDKLGRTLFLSRLHISKLAQVNDADSVFALLAQLKNVYRQLGDSYMKLQEISSVAMTVDQESLEY